MKIERWTEPVQFEYGAKGRPNFVTYEVIGRRLVWGNGSWIGYRFEDPWRIMGELCHKPRKNFRAELNQLEKLRLPANDDTLRLIGAILKPVETPLDRITFTIGTSDSGD